MNQSTKDHLRDVFVFCDMFFVLIVWRLCLMNWMWLEFLDPLHCDILILWTIAYFLDYFLHYWWNPCWFAIDQINWYMNDDDTSMVFPLDFMFMMQSITTLVSLMHVDIFVDMNLGKWMWNIIPVVLVYLNPCWHNCESWC